MRIAWWSNTHIQNVQYLLLFQGRNCCTFAPQCWVVRTWPFLFCIKWGQAWGFDGGNQKSSWPGSYYRVGHFLSARLCIKHGTHLRACWVCLSSVALRLWSAHRNIARFCTFHMLNTVAGRSEFCLVRSWGVCWITSLTLTISDTARFIHTGYLKYLNNRFLFAENSMLIYGLSLHDAVCCVWCALCAAGFVEPVLYSHRFLKYLHDL
jgi:hypothetical protein